MDLSDFIPCFVKLTISPGSTSLTNSPPTAAIAQLSEARKYVLSLFPIQSGFSPNGSLAPINFLGEVTTSAYAPLIFFAVFSTASSTVLECTRSLAIWNAITSESVVVWKIAPFWISSHFSSGVLTRFPLCASARVPIT